MNTSSQRSLTALLCAASIAACAGPDQRERVDIDPAPDASADASADASIDAGAGATTDAGDTSEDAGAPACRASSSCGLCEDSAATRGQLDAARSHLAELTDGLAGAPVGVDLAEDTNGALRVGLDPAAFPVLTGPGGALVAATRIGGGRVVAFSGQDFLSSGDRSTLLGEAGVNTLLSNATAWAAREGAAAPRVLAANDAITGALTAAGFTDVSTVALRERSGLREIYDWSAAALEGADVAIVQVNEWGTLMLDSADVPALRAFVESGGGLLVATSALHWSWWLSNQSAVNPADALLEGAGISWALESHKDTSGAQTVSGERSSSLELWCAYVDGDALEATDYPRMDPLFDAARDVTTPAELDAALTRLISETPALPADPADPKARLSGRVAVALRAYTWPAPHPWVATFPGVPSEVTPRAVDVTVSTAFKRDRPLRAYAPPGRAVTVRVPADHVGRGLRVRVGDRHDLLDTIPEITEWRRAPRLVATYPVDAAELSVGTGVGGTIYLEVPDDYPGGSIQVRVEGAIPQAVYTDSESSAADFTAALAGAAPVALLERHGKVRLVVPAALARAVTDPGAVMEFWSGFYDAHTRLASEPTPRPYASHWLFDPQVGFGYANASSDRINHPAVATEWALRTRTGDEDWWLFAHELGHQFQTSDWRGGGITEVAVNLFSMYTINAYLNGGGDLESAGFKDNAIDHAALLVMDWETAGLFERLELYRQLVFEFGWPVFERTFASYYSDQYPRATYGDHLDGFAIRFSAISGRDITPFLARWNYPLTAEAEATVSGLGLPEWLPPGW